jgi:hypothetical protein
VPPIPAPDFGTQSPLADVNVCQIIFSHRHFPN